MTIKEARKLIAVLMVTYPNYKPIDTDLAASVWAETLDDYSWNDVSNGLKAYSRTNTSGFAPSPGQIIEKIKMLTEPQELNELEAWSMVSKALRNSAYNSIEEFERLPPLVQKAVGQPGQLKSWAIDDDFNEGVASSQFMKCYRAVLGRAEEVSKMPDALKYLIDNANAHSNTANLQAINVLLIEQNAEKNRKNSFLEYQDPVEIPDRCIQKLKEIGYRN